MADAHQMAIETRAALFGDIENLSDADMDTMTCCDPWTVRHLVAHMTALGNQTFGNFARGLIGARFDFDRFVDTDLQSYLGPTDTMISNFEQTLARTKPSPGPKYVMLGEYTMHGEDIRRALGRRGEHPAARMELLAQMYAKTGKPINGKSRTDGLSFRATDGDWSFGEGAEVAGPGIDLVRAISGRADAFDTLEGPGVDTLRSRSA